VIGALRRRRLLRELATGAYDVVDCQMVMLDALDVVRDATAPVVLSFHGSDLHRAGELLPRVAAELPALLPRAAAIHAVSRFMADELVAMGAPEERIEVFQYGIDVDAYVPLVPAPRPHHIVCTRSLQPLYRTHLLIEALPELLRTVPDATLAIYGTGPEEDRLRETCARLGLGERVGLLGARESTQIAREVGSAAVWASMAETDGTPLSLLEAMAAGAVPVVADLPTLREWIEPGGGVLVEPTLPAIAAGLAEGLRIADSGAHVERNRAIVAERGKRAVNLARYEAMLHRVAEKG
jgi:glycosyltransferase involved in cell wall biosynthesis